MSRRTDRPGGAGPGLLLAAVLITALAACSTEPYPIEASTKPPWRFTTSSDLPALDPPLSGRAHRIFLCYGSVVNEEEEVLARAEDLCSGGRLVLEEQDTFWNGCSVLQPVRVTYICDPPEQGAAADSN